METTSPPKHQRVWVTTAEARETLRQLGQWQWQWQWQWQLENVEATITGWSRRKLRF